MYRLLVFSVVCVMTLASPSDRQKRQGGDNPCTPEALAAGNIYFAVPGDETEFIECDLLGHANVISCPDSLVWNEARLSCVYKFTVDGSGSNPGGGTNTGTGIITGGTGTGSFANPCTQDAIAANQLFFPYTDKTKFVQCDLWGDAYIVDCPSGLVWNTAAETCASSFFNPASGAGK